MKLKIFDHEFWIKDNIELPLNFDSMSNDEKWDYICKNKLLHKEDGPAVILSNGTKWWFLNGKRHRLDGPTFISSVGDKYWYLNGKYVDGETYKKIQSSSKEDLLVYMIDLKHKDFLPLIEYELNRKA